ncbi:hypothetical protein BDV93DRAFT_520701 [Ceratobasidium sp. AG-I]|nr:hypothetical protein BDV93DRAFT_520701 [Ceratobasidium sp. AG-I]
MAIEFDLPVLQISMAAVDKMHGPDALQALWAVFTKTTNALQDGSRLENMTWRLWHRQLLNERAAAADERLSLDTDETFAAEASASASEDEGSDGEWEDDSAPPSRDPVVPIAAHTTRRQSSTSTIQQATTKTAARPRRLSCNPPHVLSASQPNTSVRPTLTSESRTNSAPDNAYPGHHGSHGTNIGRIISNLLPEKFDVAPPSWALAQPLISPTGRVDHVPSTPKTQPVQFLIHTPSTPPNASDDHLVPHPPTLMVITPTPRPTPPDTPATRTRAVPTNIPAALSPGITPPTLAPPSVLSQPHSVLMPVPSVSDRLVSAAALPLTPTEVSAPEFNDDESKKRIFYVQSPEGATASDDGRSHSGSSNSNTTSNVTDAHAALAGQHPSSLSSATTNELATTLAGPEVESPVTPEVSAPRGANHARTSSGNAAYIRPRATKGVKVGKPPARVPYRGRPNTLVRTTSNSSDKSRGRTSSRPKHPARQQSVSEDLVEDVEETEGGNRQTSASTSHTVTSLPTLSAPLSMTPAASKPEPPKNSTPPVAKAPSRSQVVRPSASHVMSPPRMIAPASLVAPFTTIAPRSPPPTAPATQNVSNNQPRPPVTNNSSALLGLGRRAVHVETSSDLDLESDSGESWSDDESDSEDPLARAANEASRQRSMFEKIRPKPLQRVERTGLLTNLMNPDPNIYPQAAYRQHNSAQNLAAGRRGAPTALQTSRSTVAVPMAAAVTAEQITTHVTVDPKGRTVGGSGSASRGLRLKGRPEGDEEDDGSTDDENAISNELSKSYAQRRLEALASRARAPPPPSMKQVRHGEADPRAPALAPRPAAPQPPATVPYDMDVRPIHSPRTVRRKMIAGELSESLRRNLMWERTSTRFAMGGGALGSGLRPLTAARPTVSTTNSDRGPGGGTRSGDEDSDRNLAEAGRLALARNKSWANDFHHSGW